MGIRIILLAAALASSVAFAPAALPSGAEQAQDQGADSDSLVVNIANSEAGPVGADPQLGLTERVSVPSDSTEAHPSDASPSSTGPETGAADWTQVGSYSPPTKRNWHMMARDVTGRTIVFGGQRPTDNPAPMLDDTWRFNGERWIELAPAASPPARTNAAIAYDPVREETVLFGGCSPTACDLADTWAWDGDNWTERTPATSPPARTRGGMVWDEATQKVVLFGGRHPSGAPLGDTWSWDGTNWELEPAVVSPGPRSHFGFADGSATSKPVLFGGVNAQGQLGDTWTWDGPTRTWILAAATGPSPRTSPPMAYDPARGNVVLHGGRAPFMPNGTPPFSFSTSAEYSDTWTWDGTEWTQRTPPRSPWPAITRFDSALAYDAVGEEVRLFGGSSFGYAAWTNDTWAWDGTTWHEEDITAPDELRKPMLARDPINGWVLFGGQDEYNYYSQETWRWDGAEWDSLTPEHEPIQRGAAAMTYVPKTRTTILFGGFVDTLGDPGTDFFTRQVYVANDTWSWDGTDWTELQPETTPPARRDAMIAYDPARDEVVMFGGEDYGSGQSDEEKDDTWVWDGTDWIEKHPATSPPARFGGSMAYDPVRGEVVLFGGATSNSGYHADTWAWDGTDWTEVTPAAGSPPARAFGGMGWDPSTQAIVYFGGCSNCYRNPTYDETWSWDGRSWAQLHPETAPERRTSFTIVSGDDSSPLLLFGGRRAVETPEGGVLAQYPEATQNTNEVWEFGLGA